MKGLVSTVSAEVTDTLRETIMPQVDEQIKKHVNATDKERFITDALSEHEQRQDKLLKDMNAQIGTLATKLDETNKEMKKMAGDISAGGKGFDK